VTKGDLVDDFVGTGSYAANGYGFIVDTCSLLTGTATFTEKIVNYETCCEDIPWWNSDGTSWYGPGDRYDYSSGYYNDDPDTESPLNPTTALTYHNMKDKFIWSWPRSDMP